MIKAFSTIVLDPARGDAAYAMPRGPSWRLDPGNLEDDVARIFDAVRECARIAWWDGSAIGLRLHDFLGFFDGLETRSEPELEDLP